MNLLKTLFFGAGCLFSLTAANPLPQGLTEEQFRGFGDDVREVNDVKVVSGYSRVSFYGLHT